MLAYTYISHGKFELFDKPKPELQSPRDAIVRITLDFNGLQKANKAGLATTQTTVCFA